SFPSSAWERRSGSSASHLVEGAKRSFAAVRSQAELGNEGFVRGGLKGFISASSVPVRGSLPPEDQDQRRRAEQQQRQHQQGVAAGALGAVEQPVVGVAHGRAQAVDQLGHDDLTSSSDVGTSPTSTWRSCS